MLTDAQVQDYLDRISFDRAPALDEETLSELILKHQCSIPFETVTLHRTGSTPSLDAHDIYEKIVTRRLGGYCFELNKAFTELLAALGFDVQPCLCRAVRGREALMPINHRGIVVRLSEGVFSADVGFGGPMPAGALKLAHDEEQDIMGETYIACQAGHAWWNIDRVTKSASDLYDDEVPVRRQTELALCIAPVEEIDFDALNEFFSQPGTLFRDHEIVNLRTEGGYYGFKDGVLTKRVNGHKEVTELEDERAVNEALAQVFGMESLR